MDQPGDKNTELLPHTLCSGNNVLGLTCLIKCSVRFLIQKPPSRVKVLNLKSGTENRKCSTGNGATTWRSFALLHERLILSNTTVHRVVQHQCEPTLQLPEPVTVVNRVI